MNVVPLEPRTLARSRQPDPATSRQPLVSRRMLLLRMLLPQKFLRRLRARVQPIPAESDLRHDLRGCDVGATFVVSVHPSQQAPQLPRRVQVRAPAQAPVSTGGATRLLRLS